MSSSLKARVLASLSRLSDRDTFSLAASELESLALSLPPDGLAPFLAALCATDASSPPLSRQCLRLAALLCSAHGDALCPLLPRLLSLVLPRLRTPDSATRAAAVDAARALAAHLSAAPFGAILGPLLDSVFHEQDLHAQLGAVLCAAAAVEAAPEVDGAELRRVVVRLMRLLRSDCFKAKAGLLGLVGSIVGAGGASSRNVLTALVSCLVEYLGSEDWAVRKAAAETLGKVAVVERDLVVDQKGLCLSSLENRKFDKVKIVREAMTRALEAWREIPERESLMQSQSKSMSKDISSSGESSSRTSPRTSCDSGYVTPQPKKKVALSRSSSISSNSSITSSYRRSISKSDNVKSNVARSMKVEFKNDEVEVDQPLATIGPEYLRSQQNLNLHLAESENCCNSKMEAKGVPPRGASGDKSGQFNKLRYTSRVVPFCEDDHLQGSVVTADKEDLQESQKEFEGISLIREQLAQIENQQSNLLELLQMFIGSSQSGMNSLEKRVNGLEKALDEMSHDLGLSTQRISSNDTAGNTCCLLPGAEFLSPKYWRKTEGQSSNEKSSYSRKNQSIYNNKDDTFQTPKYQQFSSKSTEDIETVESHMTRRTFNKHSIDKNPQACSAGEVLVRSVRQQSYATGRV